ncbi:MAG: protein kinase [Thermomicrobiales bacterium]
MIRPRTLINKRYRVERKIGEGGMAIVYLGHDLLLARDVAIKTPHPQFASDPAFRARFSREARAAAALTHPNIIDVYDVGEEGGQPFIVMELVRGQTLKEIIATEAPFHPADVAELLRQVGGALDYAHKRGTVHRDVKPGNILIDEHRRARVVDFGIARGLADGDLTEAGGLGTAMYVSPEQASGLMATPASDIYSAGVMAFEMLTGEPPFSGDSPLAVAMQQIHDAPPAPSTITPSLTHLTDAVVLRALDKDPTHRWPSVTALADALAGSGKVMRAPTVGRAPAPPPTSGGGSSAPTFIVVLLVIAAMAGLLWFGFQNLVGTSPQEPPPTTISDAPVITQETVTAPLATVTPLPTSVPTSTAVPTSEPTPAPTAVPTATRAPEPPPIVASDGPPTIAPQTGGTGMVTVPDLRGQPIGAVTSLLTPLGLRIDLQMQPSRSAPMNTVISQSPGPGTLAPPGTTIRLTVSMGPMPGAGNQP